MTNTKHNGSAAPQTEAQIIMQEFRDYAYSVSHDLSNPVRALVEFSKLLGQKDVSGLDDKSQMYLQMITENGEKLQKMMTGLLDYSRLNTMEKPFTDVDCNILLKNCEVVLGRRYPNVDITLEVGELPTVNADIDQMMQCFLALLDNAVKFQPSGAAPAIQVSVTPKDNMWQFEVKDNGIGIAHKSFEHIFTLFRRLHTDEEFSGVGAGLTLAQKIIHRHAGSIWVESTIGQGASFFFTLPMAGGVDS